MSIAYAKEFLLIESFQQSEQYFEEITMANIDKKTICVILRLLCSMEMNLLPFVNQPIM